VSRSPSNLWHRYCALPAWQRELVTFGLSLVFALTILPLAIWLAGQVFLGDYLRDPGLGTVRHGGPAALIVDLLRGLFSGSPGHWVVLLGPYLLLWVFRVGRRLT